MRVAVNKYVVIEASGQVHGLCVANDEEEARQDMETLGITGELLTREQYEASEAAMALRLQRKRDEKRKALMNRTRNPDLVDILTLIEDSALTPQGQRAKRRLNRRRQREAFIETATEEQLDNYDPNADQELDEP